MVKIQNTLKDEPMYFWFILMQIWPQARCQLEFNSFEEHLSIRKDATGTQSSLTK